MNEEVKLSNSEMNANISRKTQFKSIVRYSYTKIQWHIDKK